MFVFTLTRFTGLMDFKGFGAFIAFRGLVGFIGFIGSIGFVGFIGLIGFTHAYQSLNLSMFREIAGFSGSMG